MACSWACDGHQVTAGNGAWGNADTCRKTKRWRRRATPSGAALALPVPQPLGSWLQPASSPLWE